MLRKILFLFVFLSCIIDCSISFVYAQWQIEYDQEANRTLHLGGVTRRGNFATRDECWAAWNSRPAYEQAHSKCVYVGRKSPGNYTGSYNSSDPAQQIAVNLFGNMLQGIFAPVTGQPDPAQEAAKAKQMELQRQQGLRQWNAFQKKEQARLMWEEKERKEKAKKLWEGMNKVGSGNSLSIASIGTGIDAKPGVSGLKLKSISGGSYDTSSLSPLDRLRYAEYFSQKAAEAAKDGKDEDARYYSRQAEKAMAGGMVDERCELSALPQVPEPPAPTRVYTDQATDEYNAFLKKQIKIKLQRVKEAKKQIKAKQRQLKQDIVKIKEESAKAKTPEEKQEKNELLRKAQQALQSSQQNIKEVEKIEAEILKQENADAQK